MLQGVLRCHPDVGGFNTPSATRAKKRPTKEVVTHAKKNQPTKDFGKKHLYNDNKWTIL